MADEQFQEKTEQATPKRLKDAREKGQIPRSKELSAAAIMIAASASFFVLGSQMSTGIRDILSNGLTLPREMIFDPSMLTVQLAATIRSGILLITPFLVICAAVAIAAPTLLGGWSFAVKSMAFKPEKLNPVEGIKRLFSLKSLVELLKTLAKFLVVGTAAVLMLKNLAGDFLQLSTEAVRPALAHTAWLCASALLLMSSALVLIAAVDVPFQLWDHAKKMRMTQQEVRDEHKETEGKPEVKSRIRSAQQEIAQRRMMEDVPKADVIVTNPTHFSVALKYDESMRAPRVTAKGADLMAQQIRKIAAAHNVPMVEAAPLARRLYATADIGQEVPTQLYASVAQLMAYVYRLRDSLKHGTELPEKPVIELAEGETE